MNFQGKQDSEMYDVVQEEFSTAYVSFAMTSYFIFVPILLNSYLCIASLQKVWHKQLFLASLFIISVAFSLVEMPAEVFKHRKAVFNLIVILGALFILSCIFIKVFLLLQEETISFML